jgi:hypothetical protein
MEVEWLILGDSAQVLGNKLYLLGGGWDKLTVNSGFPRNQRCAVAIAIKVPWNETNHKHTFEVEVVSEDMATEEPRSMIKMAGQFEVGRPPGIPQGQDQRIQLALEMNLRIDKAGEKVIIARIEGREMKRVHFNVIPGPMLSTKPRQEGDTQSTDA